MFGIVTAFMDIFHLGPSEFLKQRLKLPVIRFVDNTVDIFKTKAKTGIYNTKDILIKGSIVALITSSLLWLSILMYLAFYYTYVPSVAHERPVHLTFQPSDKLGEHTYLKAHVELTKRQQLLMLGQAYKIHLELEMPESPTNKKIGMFMVCADFHAKNRQLLTQSCRSSMLHYRSPLLEVIYTVVFSPLFLLGTTEEKQILYIELFSNYEEFESPAVTDVYIEIQSQFIELYNAKFLIIAEFSGLRYFMFNWPLLSAAIGISSNLFFIAMICIVTWYQVISSEEYKKYMDKKEKVLRHMKGSFEHDSYSSSSIEDISMVEKDKSSDSEIIEDISRDKID